jgi:hypothetical protein
MSVTWIKKSIGLTLALTLTFGNAASSFAGCGGLGRALAGRVANNSHSHSHSHGNGHYHSAPSVSYAPQYSQPSVPVYSQPPVQVLAPQYPAPIQTVAYSAPPQPAPMLPQPPMPVAMPMPNPGFGAPMGNIPVDLVIENIRFAEPSTMLVGPAYHIQVRNQGSEFAAKFQIALFASVGGVVNDECPKALLEVRDLAPGAAIEYTIRLPLTAEMMLDPATQQARPFSHLAAVVDFFRIQPESDESNNTALLPREVVDNVRR